MAVSKTPGQTCYVTIGSIDYMGPPVTVWLAATVAQGPSGQLSSLKYISPTYRVDFQGAGDWTAMAINLKLTMSPTGMSIAAGLADCGILICNGADLGTATTLYTQTWPGAFSFVYPASAWRGASGTFAAQIEGLEAQFGVMR